MVDVSTEIVIDCPREKAAEYAADPDNAPKWYVNIQSAEWQTPKPLAVGSKVAFKARFLGKELAYVYQVMKYNPGALLVMRTADGPFPMETAYIWESIDENSTRMTLRNRGTRKDFRLYLHR
ncbi:SRPBCC family protein [Paenibacillus thermotolerans]|uniref:SRPBCC family protein n=1 Tax=Paenibacillus thermotolerans TaxID=3027807 RepID=UPI002367D899|nr:MULTISPECIES: SRPBCC family protein [unclassified Paenibacillus]